MPQALEFLLCKIYCNSSHLRAICFPGTIWQRLQPFWVAIVESQCGGAIYCIQCEEVRDVTKHLTMQRTPALHKQFIFTSNVNRGNSWGEIALRFKLCRHTSELQEGLCQLLSSFWGKYQISLAKEGTFLTPHFSSISVNTFQDFYCHIVKNILFISFPG